MPSMWSGYFIAPARCRRPYRWSQMRGGCRFSPGHQGECKPKKR